MSSLIQQQQSRSRRSNASSDVKSRSSDMARRLGVLKRECEALVEHLYGGPKKGAKVPDAEMDSALKYLKNIVEHLKAHEGLKTTLAAEGNAYRLIIQPILLSLENEDVENFTRDAWIELANGVKQAYWGNPSMAIANWFERDQQRYMADAQKRLADLQAKTNDAKQKVKEETEKLEELEKMSDQKVLEYEAKLAEKESEMNDLRAQVQDQEERYMEILEKKAATERDLELQSEEIVRLTGNVQQLASELKRTQLYMSENADLRSIVGRWAQRQQDMISQSFLLVNAVTTAQMSVSLMRDRVEKAQQDLLDQRDPARIAGLFDKVISENDALRRLWEQMRVLKNANKISNFSEETLKALIMAVGVQPKRPAILDQLHEKCPSCPEPAENLDKCPMCEQYKRFIESMLSKLFMCGGAANNMGDMGGPMDYQQPMQGIPYQQGPYQQAYQQAYQQPQMAQPQAYGGADSLSDSIESYDDSFLDEKKKK